MNCSWPTGPWNVTVGAPEEVVSPVFIIFASKVIRSSLRGRVVGLAVMVTPQDVEAAA
jgi:hypothetical protein